MSYELMNQFPYNTRYSRLSSPKTTNKNRATFDHVVSTSEKYARDMDLFRWRHLNFPPFSVG